MNKSTTDNPSSASTGQDTNNIIDQAKQAATHVAGDVKERALDQVSSEFDNRKDRAIEAMDSVAHVIRDTGSKLKGIGPLSGVAGQAADGVEKVADFFDGKQIGDVVRDVERFARREPALFIGAAFAVGLIGGRFLKSSAHRTSGGGDGMALQGSRQASGSDTGYGSSGASRTPPKRFSAQGTSSYGAQGTSSYSAQGTSSGAAGRSTAGQSSAAGSSAGSTSSTTPVGSTGATGVTGASTGASTSASTSASTKTSSSPKNGLGGGTQGSA